MPRRASRPARPSRCRCAPAACPWDPPACGSSASTRPGSYEWRVNRFRRRRPEWMSSACGTHPLGLAEAEPIDSRGQPRAAAGAAGGLERGDAVAEVGERGGGPVLGLLLELAQDGDPEGRHEQQAAEHHEGEPEDAAGDQVRDLLDLAGRVRRAVPAEPDGDEAEDARAASRGSASSARGPPSWSGRPAGRPTSRKRARRDEPAPGSRVGAEGGVDHGRSSEVLGVGHGGPTRPMMRSHVAAERPGGDQREQERAPTSSAPGTPSKA